MEDHPTPEPSANAGKRGLVIALIALAAVLVVGFVAYHSLAQTGATANGSSTARSASGEDGGGPAQLADYDPTVYTAAGEALTFSQIADGRPLVVNFWATWCPYCIQEMPDFQEIYDEYSDRVSFAFVNIADGQRETVADAQAYLEDNGLTLPAYYDTEMDALIAYNATNLPTTAIVDAAGAIIDVSPGRIDPAELRATLDSLLES